MSHFISFHLLNAEDVVFNWMFNYFPIMATCLILIIATAWVTWWSRGVFLHYTNRIGRIEFDSRLLSTNQLTFDRTLRKVELNVEQLNTNQISFDRTLKKVETKVNNLEIKVDRLETKLDNLIVHLQSTKTVDANIIQTKSPLQLTDIGTKILMQMGGKAYIDQHYDDLISQIAKQQCKSRLDVQNYCSVLLNERIYDDDMIPVRDYIFMTPQYKVDDAVSVVINPDVAVSIMSLYLRNLYFDAYPDRLNA